WNIRSGVRLFDLDCIRDNFYVLSPGSALVRVVVLPKLSPKLDALTFARHRRVPHRHAEKLIRPTAPILFLSTTMGKPEAMRTAPRLLGFGCDESADVNFIGELH